MRREGVQARRHTNGCRCCGPARTKRRGLCWRARRCGRARLSVSAPWGHGGAGQARVACTKKRKCTHAAGCCRVPPSKCRGTRPVAPPCTCAKLRGARMGAAARRTRLGCAKKRGKLCGAPVSTNLKLHPFETRSHQLYGKVVGKTTLKPFMHAEDRLADSPLAPSKHM